ncbi:MAG: adenosylcobinamide-phosphate synthase CbiB [Bacilli bacterium]
MIILALIIDCIIGDPQFVFHPIRLIGKLVQIFLKIYDKFKIKSYVGKFVYGVLMTIIVIVVSFVFTNLLVRYAYKISDNLGFLVQVILSYFIIAPKSLYSESMKVYQSLRSNDLSRARINLSYIVGRDTSNLSDKGIIAACVETISENLSDGVIAPLLFILIGGVPLGMAYKAVNTLDSMVGYRNDRFEYLGKFAARVDDVVNFIPSRMSAVIMIFASVFMRLNYTNAIKVFLRDRFNHNSINSAQTESVCAGALGLVLGGTSYYNGIKVIKPTIGNEINKPNVKHIILANKLMYACVLIFIIVLTLIYTLK